MTSPAPIASPAPPGRDDLAGDLADAAFEALELLLRGFEAAAEPEPAAHLDEALAADPDHVHRGLLTALLRLVFMLLAEDRGLLPPDRGVRSLLARLQRQARVRPDALAHRAAAWPRLLAAWQALFVADPDLLTPAGAFFDPNRYPFLAAHRPDDLTVCRVLERLAHPRGAQRSFRDVDVDLLGGVYEALMAHRVVRLAAPAVCLRPQRAGRVWITAAELRAVPHSGRADFLHEHAGLAPAAAAQLAAALAGAADDVAVLDILAAARVRGTDVLPAGRLVLQPGSARRRSRSHYTPEAFTVPVVRTALAPLLAALGPEPASARLLDLALCDPAMGSGAFLVAVVRVLAEHLVAAWVREGQHQDLAPDELLARARRVVAGRCVYGVDRDPLAVDLARLTLWLVVAAPRLPFTFLDHALRCGDSLLGLSADALRGFHWRSAAPVEPLAAALARALPAAAALRRRIRALAGVDDPTCLRERARLLREADAFTERLRLVADLAIGVFFAHDRPRERDQERQRRLAAILAWLDSDAPPPAELLELRARLEQAQRPFHWILEFPEIFHPEGTTSESASSGRGIDVFVANPPFMAGGRLSGTFGAAYLDWLLALHPGAHGNADLAAHFLRRADTLLADDGTIGMIVTNTIGQGDTRTTGLQHLVAARGYTIYDATRDLPWPLDAAVTISIVHLARGGPARAVAAIRLHDPDPHAPGVLLERSAPAIDSRLRPTRERPDPRPLASNAGLSFIGTKIYGQGFILTPAERDALVARDPRNAARIFPYIGGEEVNTSPDHGHHRHVISFERMSLEEAAAWPDLLAIVENRVKPVRERQNREIRKKNWWRFGEVAPGLYTAIAAHPRCLVISGVSKHLALSFQPTDRIFSHALVVLSLPGYTAFAALQSRLHEVWARLLSSSMKTDLRYTPSDCFENFPFPQPDPRTRIPELEGIGERCETARSAYMKATGQGLTRVYNLLRDPACDEPAIRDLRALHLDLDRAVLAAYGWLDLEPAVPPYTTPRTADERHAHAAFEEAVLDRLFALNAARVTGDKPAQ